MYKKTVYLCQRFLLLGAICMLCCAVASLFKQIFGVRRQDTRRTDSALTGGEICIAAATGVLGRPKPARVGGREVKRLVTCGPINCKRKCPMPGGQLFGLPPVRRNAR